MNNIYVICELMDLMEIKVLDYNKIESKDVNDRDVFESYVEELNINIKKRLREEGSFVVDSGSEVRCFYDSNLERLKKNYIEELEKEGEMGMNLDGIDMNRIRKMKVNDYYNMNEI
jgi:hypothetical protein